MIHTDPNELRSFQVEHYTELLATATTSGQIRHCEQELERLTKPPYQTKNENHVPLVTNHSSHAAGAFGHSRL